PGARLPGDRGRPRLFVRRRESESLAGAAPPPGGFAGAARMTCDDIRCLIEEHHDRELDPARAELVRSHLAGCAVCAGELRSLERLDAALRSAPVPADDV